MEDQSLADVIQLMEERKKSAGFYDADGLVTEDQCRMIWSGLDIDVDDMESAVGAIMPSLMMHSILCLQRGIPPSMYMQGMWTDAFTIGVFFERLRNGQA